ncbi:PREDICTED: uncharacterized protein LOC109171268 [Ipomoea nil]|uniref:uncharacterized protein LOC109171268 n=1 Tax=Ipomoea nil TaxID=35883 RepID=UPI000901544D|nr:PREDICTED: uncharacterized protein LOC109171268 [Ipomoea nil]
MVEGAEGEVAVEMVMVPVESMVVGMGVGVVKEAAREAMEAVGVEVGKVVEEVMPPVESMVVGMGVGVVKEEVREGMGVVENMALGMVVEVAVELVVEAVMAPDMVLEEEEVKGQGVDTVQEDKKVEDKGVAPEEPEKHPAVVAEDTEAVLEEVTPEEHPGVAADREAVLEEVMQGEPEELQVAAEEDTVAVAVEVTQEEPAEHPVVDMVVEEERVGEQEGHTEEDTLVAAAAAVELVEEVRTAAEVSTQVDMVAAQAVVTVVATLLKHYKMEAWKDSSSCLYE